MMFRSLIAAALLLSASLCSAEDHDLAKIAKGPEGLSPAVSKLIDPNGYQINSGEDVLVEIWLVKDVALREKFKPSPSRLYPFLPGQLVGAMRVAKGSKYKDFRGQAMKPGTYTLRYGLQPEDGNHVGTSETLDFMLALPGKMDTKTTAIPDFDALSELSAKAAGSTHPAIFSLMDPDGVSKRARLKQDGFTEHWILSFSATGKAGNKSVSFKVKLVVVGQFEA